MMYPQRSLFDTPSNFTNQKNNRLESQTAISAFLNNAGIFQIIAWLLDIDFRILANIQLEVGKPPHPYQHITTV
jgi:hypothetical protein